jgi:hypothetical protein
MVAFSSKPTELAMILEVENTVFDENNFSYTKSEQLDLSPVSW